MNSERRIVCLLFADVVGYADIRNEELYTRLETYNKAFRDSTLTQDRHLYNNTWGDAFFICSGDPADMAEIALLLRDSYRNNGWLKQGFGEALQIRIGVHTATVNLIFSDGEISNVVGEHVNATARIEPIVDANEVFCTGRFVDHLRADASVGYSCDPLGERELAKGFGKMMLYRLGYPHEATCGSDEGAQRTQSSPKVRIRRRESEAESRRVLMDAFDSVKKHFRRELDRLDQAAEDIETAVDESKEELKGDVFVQGERRASFRI